MIDSEGTQRAKRGESKRKRKRNGRRGSANKSVPPKRKKIKTKTIQSAQGVFTCTYCSKVFTGVVPGSTAWNTYSNHVRSCRLKKNTDQALLAGQKLPLKDMVGVAVQGKIYRHRVWNQQTR